MKSPCAAGTARRVWNWALAEWQRQAATGEKPNAMALKKAFNRIKYSDPAWLDAAGQPWLATVYRDAHAPRFKKKGRCRDSFYFADDKLRLDGDVVVLPKVGHVRLRERLRWPGRIIASSSCRSRCRKTSRGAAARGMALSASTSV